MKIKKPSLKGMKNYGYLGHFVQDKYIQSGHNFSGKPDLKKSRGRSPDELIVSEDPEEKRTKGKMTTRDYMETNWEEKEKDADRMNSYGSDSSKSKYKYDWETTIVKGKRQHRLIRK